MQLGKTDYHVMDIKKHNSILDEFSKISLKFNNAFTPSPWTYPSIATFFTGKYPSEHGAWKEEFTFNRNTKTFAQYLKSSGYNTFMITQNDSWINSYYRLTKVFEHYYDRDL